MNRKAGELITFRDAKRPEYTMTGTIDRVVEDNPYGPPYYSVYVAATGVTFAVTEDQIV